jgi:RNA polymerase sigma-70 factor (ECF subfamily)
VSPRFVPDGRPNGLLRLGVRVARNLAISELRRLRSAPVEDEVLERTHAEGRTIEPCPGPDPLLRRTIADCSEKLPDKPSAALSARLANGGAEPDEVLATRLGMRLNTFLQNFTRARKLLAECLEQRGVDLGAELR